MSDQTVTSPKRDNGPTIKRQVTRLIQRHLHVEGRNVENFEADVSAMLADADLLVEQDRNFLRYAIRHCICPDETEPSGYAVVMNGRQYGAFVGIRRRYLEARRKRLFESLRSYPFKPSPKVER